MAHMDIFNNDAFSAMSLTTAIEEAEYVPSLLGSMRVGGRPLFVKKPVRTTSVSIESRGGTLALVPTSERGAPPTQKGKNRRELRNFNTVRLAQQDRLMADELQGIRAFGKETELMQVQQEVARRQNTLRQDLEFTQEHLRLGCVQGKVYDADGTTLIYDYYSEFDITQPAEINFALGTAGTDVRKKCTQVIRATTRALGKMALPTMQVSGLVGDAFFDDLISHSKVRDTYLNYAAAADLRAEAAYRQFQFGGINFINYRGSDDNSKVAIPVDECKFFPSGVPELFQMVQSPGESFDFVNTPGKDVYSMIIPDKDRNTYVDIEQYSYPLPICTVPKALQRAKRA